MNATQTTKPLALDLFCGAGGVARGLAASGYDVIGVDIDPQPLYPYPFFQYDAIQLLRRLISLGSFEINFGPYTLTLTKENISLLWMSPPCQGYTELNNNKEKWPKLIGPCRYYARGLKLPYVIENVAGARTELIDPIMLCGSHFGLGVDAPIGDGEVRFQLQRHRLFECNFSVEQPSCSHQSPVIGVYGAHVRCRSNKYWRSGADFPGQDKKGLALSAYGFDPDKDRALSMHDLSEMIPPSYSKYIGEQALAYAQQT